MTNRRKRVPNGTPEKQKASRTSSRLEAKKKSIEEQQNKEQEHNNNKEKHETLNLSNLIWS